MKTQAGTERLKKLADIKVLAQELDGREVQVEMRAGTGGRLYGSVTSAIVARELATMTDREIDRRVVSIAEPIREVGIYDIKLTLHPEVEANITVLIYPEGTDPAEMTRPGEGDLEGEAEAAAAEEMAEIEAEAPAEPSAEAPTDPEATEEEAEAPAESSAGPPQKQR